MKGHSEPSFLDIAQLRPHVEVAGKWHVTRQSHVAYKLPAFHLILVERGRLTSPTVGPGGGPVDATRGDFVCFYPAPRNEYTVFADTIFYQLHLRFAPPPQQRFGPWLEECGPLPSHTRLGDASEEVRRAFETACIELSQIGLTHRLRVVSAVFEILSLVAAVCGRRERRPPPLLDTWRQTRLALASRLDRELRVSDLAREMGMTPDHFIRTFRAHFGVTPSEFRIACRLREATRLLRTTDDPVKRVSYRVGFRDPNAFTRLYRRRLGVTPSEARRASSPTGRDTPAPAPEFSRNAHSFPLNQTLLPPDVPHDFIYRFITRPARQ